MMGCFAAVGCVSPLIAEMMGPVASTSTSSCSRILGGNRRQNNLIRLPRHLSLTRRPQLHRGIPCRSKFDSDAEGEENEAFKNIRKWLGQRPSLVPNPNEVPPPGSGMQINPGDSVMDIEDYFASGGAQGAAGAGVSSLPPPSQPMGTTAIRAPGEPPRPVYPPNSSSVGSSSPALNDWSGGIREDWDDWEGTPAVADLDDSVEVAELREQVIERRRARRGARTTVRDEYLRPIVDITGIYNRLAIGEREAEERVFVEAITNQYESREALKYAATLLGIPLSIGFIVSNLIAMPLWAYAESVNPDAFALTDEQKVEGAEAMHREEVRLRLEASLGQAPPLTDEQMFEHLHKEAVHFAEHEREYNKRSMLNAVSDSMSGATLFVLLLQDTSQRAILFRTIGRVFTGLSDTAKAFIIILVTDILLGYHSEEGWTAALHLFSHHYGFHAKEDLLHVFVATVPVFLDALFKMWIFVELNKIDPAAAVTLRQFDRH